MSIKFNIYDIDIAGSELFELRERDLIKGNKLTGKSHDILDELLNRRANAKKSTSNKRIINSNKPILTPETAEIIKELGKSFIKDKYTIEAHDKISEYTKSNPLISPLIFMFFQMFPAKVDNDNWNKAFGNYQGVALRRYTSSTIQKIIGILRKKDAGLFLLGTYLSVQDSYSQSGEQYYVKKVENFLKEWKHWYQQAEDMLREGKLKAMTQRAKKTTSGNTFVI